ncbi:MAG: DUF5329 domain-containing protein [Pseudomonadota bacterium]
MAFRKLAVLAAALLWSVVATAETPETAAEIEFLISAVGESGCTFVRNGKKHDAQAAEAHLRLKYRRGRKYATTAENFIERLASKSSMSRKAYQMDCPAAPAVASGDWLRARLAEYRERRTTAAP